VVMVNGWTESTLTTPSIKVSFFDLNGLIISWYANRYEVHRNLNCESANYRSMYECNSSLPIIIQ
jgi:hypothetical protein